MAGSGFFMNISDLYQTIIQQINDNALSIALSLVALVIFFYLSRKKIHRGWLSFKNRYRLNHLGVKHISNVQWPDGLGYHFTIDRLILRPDGITLLMYKQYPGKIYCADNIDDWTQMIGQKSYTFKNPFYDLDCQVNAIQKYLPDVPVDGVLFFDYTAEFPKGHPDRVIHHKSIPENLKRNGKRKVGESVLAAWKKLKAIVKNKETMSATVQLD